MSLAIKDVLDWLNGTKSFQVFDELLSNQVRNISPVVLNVILMIIFTLVVAYFIARIWKVFKSPNMKLIKKYKNHFDKTDADSKQKSFVLTLMDQVNKEIPKLVELRTNLKHEELNQRAGKIIDLVVERVRLFIRSASPDSHRCAVLILDSDDPLNLKIYEGSGYSIEGKEKLRLNVQKSIAGKAFTTGEYQYIKDTKKDKDFIPNPKSSKDFRSLLCIPIKVNETVLAVFNIDGAQPDCFTKDDIGYVQIFANQIAIILDLIHINYFERGGTEDVQEAVQNIG